MTNKTIGKLSV